MIIHHEKSNPVLDMQTKFCQIYFFSLNPGNHELSFSSKTVSALCVKGKVGKKRSYHPDRGTELLEEVGLLLNNGSIEKYAYY